MNDARSVIPRRWTWVVYLSLGAAIVFVLAALVIRAVDNGRTVAERVNCQTNLHQIKAALSVYKERHGTLPPPYTVDRNGTPLHSWRVLVLPYLGVHDLNSQYNFAEPWNGQHNRSLESHDEGRMYRCPSDENGNPFRTNYVAVIGPGTEWSSDRPERKDGMSDPIVVVEIVNSTIHWMEPKDMTIDELVASQNDQHHMRAGSHHEPAVFGLTSSGRVVRINCSEEPEAFKQLFSIGPGLVDD